MYAKWGNSLIPWEKCSQGVLTNKNENHTNKNIAEKEHKRNEENAYD